MSKLIEELKKEHKIITDVLTKVNSIGIAKPEAQKMLLDTKTELLSHLQKEDERLYSVLRKEAETNSELKNSLDNFAKDMEEISKLANDFFDKYKDGEAGFEIEKDFGRLFSSLSMRILKEEKILYAKYDEIVKE